MGTDLAGLESALIKWMQEKTTQYRFTFVQRKAVPTDSNRNQIRLEALAGNYDYLVMIDEDTFPLRNPFDLLDYDKDIIGCIYPGMGENGLRFHVYKAKDDEFVQYEMDERQGLKQVDAIGTGCVFIKRRVLEAISAPFSYVYDENGVLKESDDIAFCRRCTAAGFEIYAHWDYPCAHFKIVDLLKMAGLIIRSAQTGTAIFVG